MDNNKLYQSKSRCVIELYASKNAVKRITKLHLFTHAHSHCFSRSVTTKTGRRMGSIPFSSVAEVVPRSVGKVSGFAKMYIGKKYVIGSSRH